MTFSSLRLAQPLLDALHVEGYEIPTPIQARSIPPILEGKDLMGCAQTGTGKTAAFSLPLIQRVMIDSPHAPKPGQRRHVRALVLSPTRELASQIAQSIRAYGGKTGVRYAVIFGGVGQGPQVDSLRSGVDVLVATPGRLLDLMDQGHVDLRQVEIFVLDEADRMLDMGFVHDIRRVIKELPAKRQNLMFSATMPYEIKKLADSFLHKPEFIEIAPVTATTELVEQHVFHVKRDSKPSLLAHLYEAEPMSRVLVFTRTKHGADRVARRLHSQGIHAEAIHGNKSQNARQRALANLKNGKIAVLVATDVAARGIDVEGISHVVNYDIPNEPETYVHRIGRTGRAGAQGIAISFCDEHEERAWLRDIERLIKKKINVRTDAPAFAAEPKAARQHQDSPRRDDDRREGSRRDSGHRDAGHRSAGRDSGHRDSGHRDSGHRDSGHRSSNRSGDLRSSKPSHASKPAHAPRHAAAVSHAATPQHSPRTGAGHSAASHSPAGHPAKSHSVKTHSTASHQSSTSAASQSHAAVHPKAQKAAHASKPRQSAHPLHKPKQSAHRKGSRSPGSFSKVQSRGR